jgi:hypothetical protein
MMPQDLSKASAAFNRVGWFIPPYLQVQFILRMQEWIDSQAIADQSVLEWVLSQVYSYEHLAAMVAERYPVTPFVSDYKDTIAEAVEGHAAGLDHVAVAGLMPVVEGVARKIGDSRGVTAASIKAVFVNIAQQLKSDVTTQLATADEVHAMVDSFVTFTATYLYAPSNSYMLTDKTSRNGVLHGVYKDAEYGTPVSFYKTISAIDFLCFISAYWNKLSWLAPNPTGNSAALETYYGTCQGLRIIRPKF